MKKRLFVTFLSSIFLLLSLLPLSSCADTTLDQEAFIPAAKQLLRRAETVNTIWFTEQGIPEKEGGYEYGKYKEIDKYALQKMGFQSLDEVKAETAEIFDSETYAYIEALIFSPDEYEVGAVKRYIVHKTIPENKDEASKETIMRYTGAREYLSDIVVFHIDTLAVVSVENRNGKKRITVSVDITVENKDGQTREMKSEPFLFTEENGVFKLAALICVPYGDSAN